MDADGARRSMDADGRPPRLDELATDLLVSIAERLDAPSLGRLAQICKALATVANSNAAWQAHLARSGPRPPGGAGRGGGGERRHDARGRVLGLAHRGRRGPGQAAPLCGLRLQRRQDHRRLRRQRRHRGAAARHSRVHERHLGARRRERAVDARGRVERRAAVAALLQRRRGRRRRAARCGGHRVARRLRRPLPARIPRQPDLAPGAARRRARALAVVGGAGGRRDALGRAADGALPPRDARRVTSESENWSGSRSARAAIGCVGR